MDERMKELDELMEELRKRIRAEEGREEPETAKEGERKLTVEDLKEDLWVFWRKLASLAHVAELLLDHVEAGASGSVPGTVAYVMAHVSDVLEDYSDDLAEMLWAYFGEWLDEEEEGGEENA